MLLILDLAVGLSFVYLLFSLLVTAANELFLSALDQRSKFFKEGITELLGQHGDTIKNFFDHGLIDSFSRPKHQAPSYLPAEAFVSAVLDHVVTVAFDPQTPTRTRDLAAIANALGDAEVLKDNPKLKQSLKALLDRADGDLGKFKLEVANWFNQGMDRVTGWYKKYSQKWLFGLSLAGAVFCNVDTIHIIQGLTSDPKLRDELVNEATISAKKNIADSATTGTDQIGETTKQIKDSLAQLNSVSLPIGWGDSQYNYLFADLGHGPSPGNRNDRGPNISHILSAIVGWILTALAASLGAPFWFETLQRVVNIRGNGRSPAELAKIEAGKAADRAKNTAAIVAAATPAVAVGGDTLINAPQGSTSGL